MSSKMQPIERKKSEKQWRIHFQERNKRKPTGEEGLTFYNGFNNGWNSKMHCSANEFRKIMLFIQSLLKDGRIDLINKEIEKLLYMKRGVKATVATQDEGGKNA